MFPTDVAISWSSYRDGRHMLQPLFHTSLQEPPASQAETQEIGNADIAAGGTWSQPTAPFNSLSDVDFAVEGEANSVRVQKFRKFRAPGGISMLCVDDLLHASGFPQVQR